MSSVPIDPYSLPPLDEYNLTGTWIATMLYGMNVILFVLCMYVLLGKKARSPGQWPLLGTSTFLFILATIHIGACFRELLECFIQAPKSGIPGVGILFWLNFTSVTEKIKGHVYTFIDTTQDIVLIWRLYVVWGDNWMIAIVPFLVELTHFALALYSTEASTRKNGIQYGNQIPLVAYIFMITVNVGTTAGIAGRLWYMGRQRSNTFIASWSSVSQSSNRYLAPIFTIVESGAIFALSSFVLLGMFVRGDPKIEPAVNVATQLAATTPLLIIVRVGFGITHTIRMKKKKGPIDVSNKNNSASTRTIAVFRTVESDSTRAPQGSFAEDMVYPLEDVRDKHTGSLTDSKV